MRINEITPTLDVFSANYEVGEPALVSIETRSGMFEYLFLYCTYPDACLFASCHEHDPVITKLEFRVRGRENQFIRVLDQYDLERISRQNCHKLSNWRELHDHGQGLLIHLRDIGLTEEVSFPRRKRIQLDISLLSDTSVETDSRTFHVVVIRQNQLLVGDVLGCRFSFVNET